MSEKMSKDEMLDFLASGLIAFGFDKESATILMQLMYNRLEETEQLLFYMVSHPKATPREIEEKAVELCTSKSNMISSKDLNFPKTDI